MGDEPERVPLVSVRGSHLNAQKLVSIDESSYGSIDELKEKECEVSELMIEYSVMYLLDGLAGRSTEYPLSEERLRLHKRFRHSGWNSIFMFCAVTHILMALWEQKDPFVHYVKWTMESIFLVVYVIDIYLYISLFGWHTTYKKGWIRFRLLVFILMGADLVLRIATGFRSLHYSRALRPFVIIARRHTLRTTFSGCVEIVGRVWIVFILILAQVALFSLVDFVVFSPFEGAGLPNVTPGEGPQNPMLFRTYWQCFYDMLIIHTSVVQNLAGLLGSSQTQLLGVYNGLFFASYLIVTNLFLVRIIVAIAYRSFKAHVNTSQSRRLTRKRIALDRAFELVSTNGVLDSTTWFHVLSRLRADRDGECTLISESFVLWDGVRRDSPGRVVGPDGFRMLVELADYHVTDDADSSDMLDDLPWLFSCALRLKNHLRDFFTLQLNFLNIYKIRPSAWIGKSLVVCSVWLLLSEAVTASTAPNISQLNLLLIVAFQIDMILKLWGLGWIQYRQSWMRTWDLLCNCFAVLFLLLFWIEENRRALHHHKHPETGPPLSLLAGYKVATCLRAICFLDLLEVSDRYRIIATALHRGSAAFVRLFFFFLSVLYMWAAMGQDLYATVLVESNPILISSGWFAFRDVLNFNTFMESLSTVYNVAFLTNWPVVMNAAVMATSNAAYFFFFTLRVSMEIVVVPSIMGAMIETFVFQFDQLEQEQKAYDQRAAAPPSASANPNNGLDANADENSKLLEPKDKSNQPRQRRKWSISNPFRAASLKVSPTGIVTTTPKVTVKRSSVEKVARFMSINSSPSHSDGEIQIQVPRRGQTPPPSSRQ